MEHLNWAKQSLKQNKNLGANILNSTSHTWTSQGSPGFTQHFPQIKNSSRDFPGGSVAKTLLSQS